MILLENKKESQVLLDYDREKEYWRPVPGYEKLYEVSSKGNLISLNYRRSGEPALLRPDLRKGYLGVSLYAKRKTSKILRIGLHRLVALAFIHNPNPEKFTQINHKDEVKTNNDFRNLEWCDAKYNNSYGTGRYRAAESLKETYKAHPEIVQKRSESFKETYKAHPEIAQKLSEKARKLYKEKPELWEPAFAANRKPVNQYTKDGKLIKTWNSAAEACKNNPLFNFSLISACCRGESSSHRGFVWKFADAKDFYQNAPKRTSEKIRRAAERLKKPVAQYTKAGDFVKIWPSAYDAARDGGFDSTDICRCCNGKYKSHRGYIWKFAEGGA